MERAENNFHIDLVVLPVDLLREFSASVSHAGPAGEPVGEVRAVTLVCLRPLYGVGRYDDFFGRRSTVCLELVFRRLRGSFLGVNRGGRTVNSGLQNDRATN